MGNNFNCRICSKKDFELIIDLGMHPWGNHFLIKNEIGKEPKYPLRLLYCMNCGLPQLDFTVKKEIKDYVRDHYKYSGWYPYDVEVGDVVYSYEQYMDILSMTV